MTLPTSMPMAAVAVTAVAIRVSCPCDPLKIWMAAVAAVAQRTTRSEGGLLGPNYLLKYFCYYY